MAMTCVGNMANQELSESMTRNFSLSRASNLPVLLELVFSLKRPLVWVNITHRFDSFQFWLFASCFTIYTLNIARSREYHCASLFMQYLVCHSRCLQKLSRSCWWTSRPEKERLCWWICLCYWSRWSRRCQTIQSHLQSWLSKQERCHNGKWLFGWLFFFI